jgi:hypothetical protein
MNWRENRMTAKPLRSHLLNRPLLALALAWGLPTCSLAATITFDNMVSGVSAYGYDGDQDGVSDVIFSTTDPMGFNSVGPGPNMKYIQEPGIEGSTSLQPWSLRVDFLRGATGSLSYGFALCCSSGPSLLKAYDNQGNLLGEASSEASRLEGSSFPEGMVTLSQLAGVAAYATIGFMDGEGRYIIDNFSGDFGSISTPAEQLPGASPLNPLLPSTTVNSGAPGFGSSYEFVISLAPEAANGGRNRVFIDPDVAIGYEYVVNSGPAVASVLLPSIGDDRFGLALWNGSDWVDTTYELWAGIEFDFTERLASDGLRRFRITGIETASSLDPNDPLAFVTGLTFLGGGTVSITQTALTTPVPEPSAWVMLVAGSMVVGLRKRRPVRFSLRQRSTTV